MPKPSAKAVHLLFLINLGLQVWDGLATYQGLQLGFAEANPLLQAWILDWGVGWALLSAKVLACGFLFCMQLLRSHPVIQQALTLTALWYATFSVLPWGYLLFFSWLW